MKGKIGLLGLFFICLISCEDDQENSPNEMIPDTVDPIIAEEDPVILPQNWCLQEDCWDPSVFTCRDSVMIATFTRSDNGWTGGDATYSIALPGNRNLWLFGDSFIGQVRSDRSRSSLRLINNSLVIQDSTSFTTYHGGTTIVPEAFAKPADEATWYWPASGRSDQDTLYVFMHAFGTTGGMWGFYRTGVDLLKMNPYTMEIYESTRIIEGDGISYGAHVMEDGDYAYIYGVLAENPDKWAYVARTDLRFSKPWQYYGNGEWSTESTNAKPIFHGVSEQFSVFRKGEKYYMLTQHNIFGKEIYLYASDSPVGPWENKKVVYCTPETGGDIFTYNAYAHPQFSSDGELLISYNINSFDFGDLAENADNYRPFFVTILNWED
jgi:hypothetical protein